MLTDFWLRSVIAMLSILRDGHHKDSMATMRNYHTDERQYCWNWLRNNMNMDSAVTVYAAIKHAVRHCRSTMPFG
jgi:hypothetical protein